MNGGNQHRVTGQGHILDCLGPDRGMVRLKLAHIFTVPFSLDQARVRVAEVVSKTSGSGCCK